MKDPCVIDLKHVTKCYGQPPNAVMALANLDLQVPQGEFLSVMGPSGSGKTTLLNLIAGLDTPTTGQVVVLGRDLAYLSGNERSRLRLRQIGIVFQSFNLFPTFTAEENVAWPVEFLGERPKVARERAGEALARVGVDAHERLRRPAELSQGEQQRVAIARALVTRPKLLLADEPTGNLDSQTGTRILNLLRELNRGENLSVLLVTHSAFAATYGHRTIEVRDGRIEIDVRAPERPEGHVVGLRRGLPD